jgi:hypothetical protein
MYNWVTKRCVVSAELGTLASKVAMGQTADCSARPAKRGQAEADVSMELIEKTRLADFSVSRKGESAAPRRRRRPFEEKMKLAGLKTGGWSIINRTGESIMEIPV